MPFHGLGWGWRVGVAVVLCTNAWAENLDNGISSTGHLDIDVDAFGSYAREVGPQADDPYWPVGTDREEAGTFMSSSWLFMSSPIQGAVSLTSHQKIINKVENNGDGIKGPASLARTLTMPITITNGLAHSEFKIEDAMAPGGRMTLQVMLDQKLVVGNPNTITRLEQDYKITNTGVVATTLVFHTFWDMDLYWTLTSFEDDYVGTGPGTCYVYQHDPGVPQQGGSLGDGGSTTPMYGYYGGKIGYQPNGGVAYTSADAAGVQPVWDMLGMPSEWRNNIAYLGTNEAGVATDTGDAMLGMEWRFTLAPNETHTIKVRRHYGTNSVPCNVSATCGNGTVDANETCETAADTASCNAGTCTAPACNDGYLNTAAGEECESAGVDSSTCVGATCKLSVCGDDYVNAAAGETCDDDSAMCDENCQVPKFSIGGGCAGCAGGGDASWLAMFIVLLPATARTRRRAPLRESHRSAR